MDSSSSLPFPAPLQEKYDVFLSFRGEDTRDAFTSHLHAALLRKNIDTYIDNRLEKGDDIGPTLLEAVEKSKLALVIFSKDYASSTWCLKELVHILGCKKSHGQVVIPIFYRIDPSDVRKQQGTYALEDRPLKRSRDEVANWRAALEEAANMSGFHYSSKTGTEADFVEKVAQVVLTKLNRESSSDLKGLVGIEKKIGKIESLLCLGSPGVCCVGIWGMGGIGKTTLADAVFHRQSSKFEVCCFLANVREKSEKMDGLNDLRNTLVRELLKDERVNINTLSIPRHIQDRLRRTKALIVLDDVNARKQLEYLVGDHDRFCDKGSRIIITARDKGLLEQKVDPEKIYNVEGLCSDEALKLFHSHAFGIKSPTTDYIELSREVVDYIKGIPLALKVMGSSFRRCKSKQEWEDQWKKVKEFPDEEINQVLRISYDGLGKHEKEIFLDIACFHKCYERNYVKEVLDGSGFHGEAGINDLIDRSLISISYSYDEEWIEMHDLVEEMGKAIAQGSRLLMAKDVNQLLANNQSDGHVQSISIDWREMEYANFEKMRGLRLLRVNSFEDLATSLIGSLGLPNSLRYLDWYRYPLKSLPSKFSAQNLVVLEMEYSQVEGQLWNEDQGPVNLKWICLNACKDLTEVPNLSRSLKIEHIEMNDCQSLVEIPSYFQHLGKLTYLDLGGCTNLKILPEMPCNLEVLLLSDTAIEELPSSVWSHEKISRLDITSCEHLKSLPSNTCKLKLSLSLEGCISLFEFWELPRDTTELELTCSTIKELRINASIESAVGLTAITLNYCVSLVSLPTNIWKLKSLKSLDLQDCSNFQNFPEISEVMEYLEFLNLSGTMVKELPPSIRNLVALRELNLKCCNNLESLPELPPLLQYLTVERCTSLKTVSSSSTALAQGWEKYKFSRGLQEQHIFLECPELDENARSNIMADAQLRIMRMATASSKFKEDKIEEPSYDSDDSYDDEAYDSYDSYDDFHDYSYKESFVGIRCCGNEIPKWFSHKSEGCSIKIELPRDWFSTDFLGFALSLVVVGASNYLSIRCKYNFKTSNGESHDFSQALENIFARGSFSCDGVMVWWYNQRPTVFYKLVTEVNVDFTVWSGFVKEELEVKKCGICLLYGKDAEMIKQRAL